MITMQGWGFALWGTLLELWWRLKEKIGLGNKDEV